MASPPKSGIWLKRSSVAQCHLLWEGARVAICKGDCPWIAAGGCGAGMGALFCSLWGAWVVVAGRSSPSASLSSFTWLKRLRGLLTDSLAQSRGHGIQLAQGTLIVCFQPALHPPRPALGRHRMPASFPAGLAWIAS